MSAYKKWEQKTERQLLMALRNMIISIGHSIKSPQVFSPAGKEAETSCYRITIVSPVCSLMVSSALTSPAERNFQLPLQRIPSESCPTSQDSPAGFHEVHKQCTAFSFYNIVHFSKRYGNTSTNTSTSNMETYTPLSQQNSGIYFPRLQQHYGTNI